MKEKPESEEIWMAAMKVENESGEVERARQVLKRARDKCPTEKVWRKSAEFERDHHHHHHHHHHKEGKEEENEDEDEDEEKKVIEEGLERFPTSAKLWQLRCEMAERREEEQAIREVYQRAIKVCNNPNKATKLWLQASRFEENSWSLSSSSSTCSCSSSSTS